MNRKEALDELVVMKLDRGFLIALAITALFASAILTLIHMRDTLDAILTTMGFIAGWWGYAIYAKKKRGDQNEYTNAR
jgi:glycopeptide antibiotics resistance protein